MPINRALWHRVVAFGELPGLPCPRCESGKLKLVQDGFKAREPRHSSEARANNDMDWEPDWDVQRWSAMFECDEKPCGEVVNMIGDTEVVAEYIRHDSGDVDLGYAAALRIRAVFPAPPMIRLSDNVPKSVRDELGTASRMYWTDTSACVARLRTAVEKVLDHQKVPREGMSNKGKPYRMDLHKRIGAYADGAVHKEQLNGLRNIGNLGTHGNGDVEDGDLFDALDVLEYVLAGIYDTKTINAKAQRLSSKKAKGIP